MKKIVSAFIFLLTLSCTQKSDTPVDRDSVSKTEIAFDISSAQRVLEIARDISSGKVIDENTWNELGL